MSAAGKYKEELKKYSFFSPGLIACNQECRQIGDVEVLPLLCITVCPLNKSDKSEFTENQMKAAKAIAKIYCEKKDKDAAQILFENVPEQPTTNKGQNTGSTVGN